MVDGNIYFVAGKEKNISFRVDENASIMLGDLNILQLPNKVVLLKRVLKKFNIT